MPEAGARPAPGSQENERHKRGAADGEAAPPSSGVLGKSGDLYWLPLGRGALIRSGGVGATPNFELSGMRSGLWWSLERQGFCLS